MIIMYRYTPVSAQLARTSLDSVPAARAVIQGDRQHSQIRGTVRFYPAGNGTLVTAEIEGLPDTPTGIYAIHIHQGNSCSGNAEDPFADVGEHYNPTNAPHPLHAGDLLPLFGNNGFAVYSFYTERFMPGDIIGRAIIIHRDPDDFRSQPSGNAGAKIACGIISRV
jgi:Cu-Zn family superoxide dismutase